MEMLYLHCLHVHSSHPSAIVSENLLEIVLSSLAVGSITEVPKILHTSEGTYVCIMCILIYF